MIYNIDTPREKGAKKMVVYNGYQLSKRKPLIKLAQEKLDTVDFERLARTGHFLDRVEERNINLNKISSTKMKRATIYEVKLEGNEIISVGIRVSYNKKQVACMIIGFKTETPMVVTSWLMERK